MSTETGKFYVADEAIAQIPSNRVQVAGEAVGRASSAAGSIYAAKRRQSVTEKEIGYDDADERDIKKKQVRNFLRVVDSSTELTIR